MRLEEGIFFAAVISLYVGLCLVGIIAFAASHYSHLKFSSHAVFIYTGLHILGSLCLFAALAAQPMEKKCFLLFLCGLLLILLAESYLAKKILAR